jgi:hypothetical protein
VANVAITNLPATKNIDALVRAKAELEAVTAKQETEILKLRREAHNSKVLASVKELENAGIPTVIISRVRPLLEQMNTPTLTLTRDGKTTQTTAAGILQSVLLEMARIGIVRTGETTQRTETSSITLVQAVAEIRTAWAKDGKKNLREADIYLAARKKYPHLKEG